MGGDPIPTAKKMSQKEIEEANYHNILELFRYTDFVYNRGRLMIDLMNRLNSTTNYPLNNGSKYTLILLQTSIFLCTIDELVAYLKHPQIKLPSGRVINKDELDMNSRTSLTTYIDEYITKLMTEKVSFSGMILQIASKLQSQSYVTRFPDMYKKYSTIFMSLDDLVKHGKYQPMEFYENYYKQFFANECRLREDETNDIFLRIYYMCIVLARMKELIPVELYNDKDAMGKQRENFDKIGKDALIKNIQKHKFW